MLHLISCPGPSCGAPAEVTDRFTLASTDGPVEHVKTLCARQHGFVVPVDRLVRAEPVTDEQHRINSG